MGSSRDAATYPERTLRRSLPGGRIARALGFDPLCGAMLVAALSVGIAVGALVAAVTEPARAGLPAAGAAVLLTGPPPWETTWLMPIELHHGRPVGGVQRLEVDQGDEVAIGINLDSAATVSVEGYGLWTYVHPYQQGLLELTAAAWGEFRVRADGRLIGVLTIRPQWAGSAVVPSGIPGR